jgi:DNA-binding CsgD family transcriptional regulator
MTATASIAEAPTALEPAQRLRAVQDALSRLSRATSLAGLAESAPRELCSCGLDRAMLTNLCDGKLAFASAAHPKAPEREQRFPLLARTTRVNLLDCPPELEAVTTQRPVLVGDPQNQAGVFRPLVIETGTNGYVVAPVVHGGQTIGLLHADRFHYGPPLDEFDAELVSVFALGLGAVMRGITIAAPAPLADGLAEVVRKAAAVPGGWAWAPQAGALSALTAREREVLDLLAVGQSNQAIAETLVVSETTVKSHVRGVLRKLEAANRTEAVARYHALVGGAVR